jgi:hypothetical protein
MPGKLLLTFRCRNDLSFDEIASMCRISSVYLAFHIHIFSPFVAENLTRFSVHMKFRQKQNDLKIALFSVIIEMTDSTTKETRCRRDEDLFANAGRDDETWRGSQPSLTMKSRE